MAGLIYHFLSNVIYFPKKSVKKKSDWQNISRLKNTECPCAIFGPASHKVHKTLLTLQLAAKIVLSKESSWMETAGPRIQGSRCIRVNTNIPETKKGTICFACCSLQAPAREDSSLTLWRLQLSSGPSGTENLPACLPCDLFCYRQPRPGSIISGDQNTPSH